MSRYFCLTYRLWFISCLTIFWLTASDLSPAWLLSDLPPLIYLLSDYFLLTVNTAHDLFPVLPFVWLFSIDFDLQYLLNANFLIMNTEYSLWLLSDCEYCIASDSSPVLLLFFGCKYRLRFISCMYCIAIFWLRI